MHFLLDKVIDHVYFKDNKLGVISFEIRVETFLSENPLFEGRY